MDFHFLVMEKSWKINFEKEGTLTAENDKRTNGQGLHVCIERGPTFYKSNIEQQM